MPRFADDRQVVQPAKQAKEAAGPARVEGERRRQLNQERTERVAEPGDLAEEPGQRLARSRQRALVGDQLGDLDGEAERRRHGGGPALIDRRRVRAVEGGIDLGGVQAAGVALQLRAVGGETVAVRARDVPPGGPDVGGHASGQSKKQPGGDRTRKPAKRTRGLSNE